MWEIKFKPYKELIELRRRVAPGAKFNPLTKTWTMPFDRYEVFLLEARSRRRDSTIEVIAIDGKVIERQTSVQPGA